MDTVRVGTRGCQPLGPFSLARQNQYFGGWPTSGEDGAGIVMAFPVEGRWGSAAVALRQDADGALTGTVAAEDLDAAWRQSLAIHSLDVDGRGYPGIGERDPVIGRLQAEHAHLRPVLFNSPYEAACAFVIAHRLSMVQGRAIRARIAERHGEAITVVGRTVHAFPAPQRLLTLDTLPGLTEEKVRRLHGIARAALDGGLERERLRQQPVDQAIADVRRLRGIGDFFAAGIVLRGAGMVDAVPDEEITRAGIRRLYGLPGPLTASGLDAVTRTWQPYRMWCSVLVHVAERRHRPHTGEAVKGEASRSGPGVERGREHADDR
jgi:DNA-3-methyladenine glycosylase II